MEARESGAHEAADTSEFSFPRFVVCHGCGMRRHVISRELYEMPEGKAGVVWANCRKCRHTFVRFVGQKKPVQRLMERWLGLNHR